MASYYRTIKGKKYDRALLDLAESLTSGRGDGRISLQDARAVLNKVKDGGEYSDTEKRTMQYIRDNFKFTDSANKWFRDEIRKWAATKKKTVKKAPTKTAAKKTPTKKKGTAKKASPGKGAAKKKSVKKAPAKKKSAPKKAIKKKTAPKAQPVPAEPYISTIPDPSPILQHEQYQDEKEGFPWIKLLIALIIIAAAVYCIKALWNEAPAGDTGSSAVKIEKKTDVPEKASTPPPVEKIEEPVDETAEISIERQAPVVESIESLKVYFAKGSGWINHTQRNKLLKIAEYLKANPDRKIFIIGHGCSLGNPKLNNDLSLYRARNAAKYLKIKGVTNGQISLTGIGEKHPVKQGLSPENLWENRLIEFDVR